MDKARENKAHEDLVRLLNAKRVLRELRERDVADPWCLVPDDEPFFAGGMSLREERVADQNS